MARKILFVACSILVAASILLGGPAESQMPNSGKKPRDPYRVTALSSKVALPDLPDYTGQATFHSGSVTDQHSGGSNFTSYTERWLMREPKARVVDWYSSTLKSYGWTLRESGPKNLIYASKGPNSCRITIYGTMEKGYATEVHIAYTQGK